MDDATLAALKQKHGPLTLVLVGTAPDKKEFALRKPSRLEYRRARQLINDDKHEEAIEAMLQCVVYPDRAGVDAALEDLPALETRLSDSVFELAGLRTPLEKKSC